MDTNCFKYILITASFLIVGKSYSQQDNVNTCMVKGVIKDRKSIKADSVAVSVFDVLQFGEKIHKTPIDKGGNFNFNLTFPNKVAKISIWISEPQKIRTLVYERLLEPGDSLLLEVDLAGDQPIVQFKGNTKIKYAVEDGLNIKNSTFISQSTRDEIYLKAKSTGDYTENNRLYFDGYKLLVNYLNQFKERLSTDAYNYYRVENIRKYFGNSHYMMYLGYVNAVDTSVKTNLKANILNFFDDNGIDIDEYIASLSQEYLLYLMEKEQRKLFVLSDGQGYKFKDIYDQIRNGYKGILLERLLTYFLGNVYRYRNVVDFEETDYINAINDAKKFVKIKPFQNLYNVHQKFLPGAKAFNFSLPDVSGKFVSLEDLRGKVVLVDIWGEGCTGCSVFYRRFEEKIAPKFIDKDFVVVSISIDRTVTGWIWGINSKLYTNRSHINLHTNGLVLDHPFTRYYEVNSIPFLVLIDKKGKIISKIQGSMSDDAIIKLISEGIYKD